MSKMKKEVHEEVEVEEVHEEVVEEKPAKKEKKLNVAELSKNTTRVDR